MSVTIDGTNGITTPAEDVTGTGVWSVGGTQLYKDTNGNLGLGVTPSGWGSGVKAIELPQGGAIFSFISTNPALDLYSNAYYNGTNVIYKTSNFASAFQLNGGGFQWYTAPSGTAGSPITFTQAMTLDNSGNLLVGTTTSNNPSQGVVIQNSSNAQIGIGHANGTGTGQYYIYFDYNSSTIGGITQNGTTSVSYNTTSDPRLKNITGLITPTMATNFVMGLQPKYGTWKADGSNFQGFVTTDYLTVDPSAVVGTANATQPIGNVTDSTGKILQTGVPQPTNLPTGETWTQTGTQDVYQSMEYGSPAWCANMTAFVQNLQNTITALEAKLKAAGVAGF